MGEFFFSRKKTYEKKILMGSSADGSHIGGQSPLDVRSGTGRRNRNVRTRRRKTGQNCRRFRTNTTQRIHFFSLSLDVNWETFCFVLFLSCEINNNMNNNNNNIVNNNMNNNNNIVNNINNSKTTKDTYLMSL